MLTIGRLAKEARVSTDSIRFYERHGLLRSVLKTTSGYRLFAEDTVRRLAFIKHAQQCGFTLSEIKALVEHCDAPDGGVKKAYYLASRKKVEIDRSLVALQAMSQALASFIDTCGAAEAGDSPYATRPRATLEDELERCVAATPHHIAYEAAAS